MTAKNLKEMFKKYIGKRITVSMSDVIFSGILSAETEYANRIVYKVDGTIFMIFKNVEYEYSVGNGLLTIIDIKRKY